MGNPSRPAHDVRIKRGDQSVEVSIPRSGEEGRTTRCSAARSARGRASAPRMRPSPRLPSWRAASGERSRIAPISSNPTENMSWRTTTSTLVQPLPRQDPPRKLDIYKSIAEQGRARDLAWPHARISANSNESRG
jgi:hypothetical protein